MKALYLILNKERSLCPADFNRMVFWKAMGEGYTHVTREAGRYLLEEAKAATDDPDEVIITANDLLQFLLNRCELKETLWKELQDYALARGPDYWECPPAAAAEDRSEEARIHQVACAILNARGNRRGVPTIANILDLVPVPIADEARDDARAVLAAIATAGAEGEVRS